MINTERRKRVMQRSIKLGHCICDPRKPCPCDLFKEKNICLCAGESIQSPAGTVRLTELIEKPGCASKIDQAFLKQTLKDLPAVNDPRVLVGMAAGDDAGVYDLGDGRALVQTVDVFTPSVDDPYTFGLVAAANSVSDIYAMGGEPLTAVSVIGFPAHKVPDEVMRQILAGGIDKMNEASVAVIGGHSINDDEIKAGFCVTGIIDKDKIVTNANAKPGDVLILTKPLGTGIIAFARQIKRARDSSVDAATKSMATLNKKAAELMVKYGAHACTDVTGFSLMGHLSEMALSSEVDAEVIWDEIPLFPGVVEYAAESILPGAIERNKESCSNRIVADSKLPAEMIDICYDAQTSGGLLISIAAKQADMLLKALHKDGITDAAIIGKVNAKGTGIVHIKTTGKRRVPSLVEIRTTTVALQNATGNISCCADAVTSSVPGLNKDSEAVTIKTMFTDFLSTANNPHSLDAYTKQAMAIALSVAMRCEPCLKMHLKKAAEKGFTQDEIDEAAWMGISFAGSPAMVFYEQIKTTN
jgi:selenide, water dikinase